MKNKAWIIFAFVLLAANLLLLSLFLIKDYRAHEEHPHHRHHPPATHEQDILNELAEHLHFDRTQYGELMALRSNFKQRRQIRDSLDVLKTNLFTNGARGNFGTAAEDSLLKKIESLHGRLDRMTLRYFHEIRNICKTDEQKRAFDDFVDELVSKTLRRGPPRPPGIHPRD